MGKTGLQTANRSNSLVYWNTQVSACRGSGQRVKDWCEAHGVPLSTYYYWQRQVYLASMEPERHEGFIEIQAAPAAKHGTAAITIPFCNTEIAIHNGADADILAALLHAIRSC